MTHRESGLSLLEMLLVLAIGLILLGVSVVGWRSLWQHNQLQLASERCLHWVRQARWLALQRGQVVQLRLDDEKRLVISEQKHVLQLSKPLPNSIHITWRGALVQPLQFGSDGHADFVGSFWLCAQHGGMRLVVGAGGRVRQESVDCDR